MSDVLQVKKTTKKVSLETIKRKLKKLAPQKVPVLFTYGNINLYWFHSPRKYITLSNELELLHNLREFCDLNLEKKQLNKYYEIHKQFYNDEKENLITSYKGSYDLCFAGGILSFGYNLNNGELVAKYHN